MTMENGDGEPYAHQDWRLFEELRSEKSTPFDELPDHVSCYVCKIQPKHCGKVVKELGYLLPLIKIDTKGRICDEAVRDDIGGHGHGSMPPIHVPVLGHLRRVRRIRVAPSTEEETNQHDHEPPKKRGRKSKMNRKSSPNVELEILIGAISHVNHLLHHVAASSSSGECKGLKLKELLNTHEINLEERVLPGRPAKSRTELDEWNSQNEGKGWWPSLYFEKQTLQFKQKELEIDMKEEWGMMRNGMLDAIKDALKFRKEAYSEGSCGVVIVCPKTQTTVASSYQEWKAQVEEEDDTFQDIKTKLQNHPLLTNCLLAIQGVSRLERLSAMGHGMDSEAFKNGQVSH